MTEEAPNAIVVLGCRVRGGRPTATLERRLLTALTWSEQNPLLPVVLSGGRRWDGVPESESMRRWWEAARPEAWIVEEAQSRNTRENAEYSVRLCRAHGWKTVALVTSDFHMLRASFEFERQGVQVRAVPAETPAGTPGRLHSLWRERVAILLRRALRPFSLSLALLLSACPSQDDQQKAQGAKEKRSTAETSDQTPSAGPPLELDALTPGLRQFARTPRFSLDPAAHAEGVGQAKRALYGTPEQRLWATFGLGRYCARAKSPEVLAALVNATSLWSTEASPPPPLLLANAGWAIGSCALPEAEEVLRAWLSPDTQLDLPGLDAAAAFGLAANVDRRGAISERTQSAVLNAADRLNDTSILLPLARLPQLSEAVGAHLLEVAGTLLTEEGKGSRRTAILTLRGAGASAATPLAQILVAEGYTPEEHAAAAHALGQLGEAGQRELDEAVATQLSRGLPLQATNPRWIPLLSSIDQLERAKRSKRELSQLSEVALPPGDDALKAAQRRRLIRLRCRAADLLAETASLSANLAECDPEKGRAFALAQLRVLDRDTITERRREIFDGHIESQDPLVAQAALRMLARHPELENQPALILAALDAPTAGSQTTALQLVAAYPGRFGQGRGLEEHQALLTRIGEILGGDAASKLPQEVRAAALLAAGALHALNLKPVLVAHCKGKDPLLWEPAERALSLLEKKPPTCPPDVRTVQETEPERDSPPPEPKSFTVESDLGDLELQLDGTAAPEALRHVLQLLTTGEYDGSVIGSSRLGFAVQFGDEQADGYDDVPSPGLPFEVSPQLFQSRSVGLNSFAPGSENRQLFVTLTEAPQLHGTRIRLGSADGPWDLLVEGDVLHRFVPLTK